MAPGETPGVSDSEKVKEIAPDKNSSSRQEGEGEGGINAPFCRRRRRLSQTGVAGRRGGERRGGEAEINTGGVKREHRERRKNAEERSNEPR